MSVFYQDAPHFQVKDFQPLEPNMTSFQLDSGGRRWFIVRYYIALDDASTIEYVIMANGQRPHRDALLLSGDFNVNLAAMQGNHHI